MQKRPTIALCCILKNEAHNLTRLLSSVEGCFDEIHLTDTGSVDGSIELIEKFATNDEANPARTPIFLKHFKWIDDFAAARNFSFEGVKTDYVMWLDLDDVLQNKEAFLEFRNNAMGLNDYWLATYHYGFNERNEPVCSFMRERVFKTSLGLKWKYFIHEGITPKKDDGSVVTVNYCPTWSVGHMRSAVDLSQDRARNLRIFEKNKANLDARMKYYYGKELFDCQQVLEAVNVLMEAVSMPELEAHDRTLGLQYLSFGLMALNQWERAIQISHQGLQIAPTRAEFFIAIADSYLKKNSIAEAIVNYYAAAHCPMQDSSQGYAGMVFSSAACYREYPHQQLARIFLQIGNFKEATKMAERALELNPQDKVSVELLSEIQKIVERNGASEVQKKVRTPVEDIVITCPPSVNLYEWDEEIAKERSVGGSETAAIYLAKYLAKHTKRPVKIFHQRSGRKDLNGVEYIQVEQTLPYLSQKIPALHIKWRHNLELPESTKEVTWCHDLITPGVERARKVAVLSEFHASYMKAMQGVDRSKMFLTSNGIQPERFANKENVAKVLGKVVFSSSPDRGLDRCMYIMDEVIKEVPNAKLHVFYGFDNMRKMGMNAEADRLEKLMRERAYVEFHGGVKQDELIRHFMESEIWLYPANFIETFCISALEAVCSGTWGVTRRVGALSTTAGQFAAMGQLDLLDENTDTAESRAPWVQAVISALKEQKWKKVNVRADDYSWERVALQWIKEFELA